MKRLIKNEIFLDLNYLDLNICVSYIKGKQIKHTKKRVTRNT